MKGCRRVFLGFIVLGLVGLILLAVTGGVMVSLGPPEQKREVSSLVQEIDRPRLSVDGLELTTAESRDSLQVSVELKEGEFRILPGKPGEGIRIEADYDSGIYALEQKHQLEVGADESTAEQVTIRFYSKYSILRRLLTLGDEFEPDNRIDIYLPPDVPMNLKTNIRIGESHLDLSGLPLTQLESTMTMGEHELQIDTPNPLQMDKMHVYASKGEFRLEGLGNANFRTASVRGSMGEVSLDLRGDYTQDATVSTQFRMGELRITVPEDIHVDVAPSSVTLGEQHMSVQESEDIPENAPTLQLQTSLSMGELNIRSTPAE